MSASERCTALLCYKRFIRHTGILMRFLLRSALLFLTLLSPATLAANPQKTLAVLEFRSKLAKDAVDVGYLTDVVRTAAKDAVPDLKVMTRENMFVLLQASGKKMEDCEGECEVDTGRRVGADLVISGDVLRFGTQFKVNMKLHDTHSGELLQGAQASGGTLDELDKNLNLSVSKLLTPLGARQEARSAPSAPSGSGYTTSAPRPSEPRSPQAQDVRPTPMPRESGSTSTPSSSMFGFGVFGMLGYYSWDMSVSGSTTPIPSTTGLTYGVSAHVEYKLGQFGLGLLGQYNSMQYENTTTLQTATTSGVTLAPMGRLRLAGETAVYVAVGFATMSENQGTGLALLAGLDLPLYGVLAARAQLAWRAPATTGTISSVVVDVSSNILTGEVGLGVQF